MTVRSKPLAVAVAALFAVSLVACDGEEPGPDASTSTTAPPSLPVPTDTAPSSLEVAVFGDSVGFGRRLCGGCETFVDLYADALTAELGTPVEAANLSINEQLQIAELARALFLSPEARQGVASADILILTVGQYQTPWAIQGDPCDGGDDLGEPTWENYTGTCLTDMADRLEQVVGEMLQEAKELRDGAPTVQIVTTSYNDWTGWERGVPPEAVEPLKTVKDLYAAALCNAAEAAGAVCVDVYHAFNGPDGTGAAGDLLAEDYAHPSAAGHQVIADLLMDVDVSAVTGG